MTVVSDRRTNVVNLAVGEALSLTEGGSIFVNGSFGIHGTGGNAVTLAGDIMARADTATGVQLDLGGSVSVLATSLVYGGQTGINTASAANISNAGEIIGLSFAGISTGGAVAFSNSGVVYGDIFALAIGGASFAGSTVTNTGLLQSSGTGIRIFPDNNYILNFGTIDGGQDGIAFGGTAGTDVVINWGTIIGHNGEGIEGDASGELIVNRGVIRGFTAAVDLKAGNDTFDNSLGGVVFAPILMGAGNDTVIAGQGAELIDGGDGSDTVSYANSPKGVLINLVGQVTTDAVGVQDNLSSIENAVGSAFDDALYGDATANVLDGGPDGSDLISGAGGSDTVSYVSSTRSVLINLAGQATADGVNTDTLSSIENAIGSAFSDVIHGDAAANVLDGGVEGSDQINGAGGLDTVSYATSARSVLINLAGQATADGTTPIRCLRSRTRSARPSAM
jgi:hypothetical protein